MYKLSSISVNGGDVGIELYKVTYQGRPYLYMYIYILKQIGAVDSTIRGGVKRSEIQASMLPSSHTCNCAYYISHDDVLH